ncbi:MULTISPECIES: hypothetical protein [unclassified Enterococcus]|uniref:hypothetical protein n=1 Tax=unclassified Enterococcus TaxID=2608891 RepID=UPI0013ECF119|nr:MULTISPECIES: hypothetical protein [unclassified Enterococcus]
MSKNTNPYWREESRIYRLKLDIAKTDNLEKKRRLQALLEREEMALRQRKAAKMFHVTSTRRTSRKNSFFPFVIVSLILLAGLFLFGRYFYLGTTNQEAETVYQKISTLVNRDKTQRDTKKLPKEQVIEWISYHMSQADPNSNPKSHRFETIVNEVNELEITVYAADGTAEKYLIDSNGHLYHVSTGEKVLVADSWDVPVDY